MAGDELIPIVNQLTMDFVSRKRNRVALQPDAGDATCGMPCQRCPRQRDLARTIEGATFRSRDPSTQQPIE